MRAQDGPGKCLNVKCMIWGSEKERATQIGEKEVVREIVGGTTDAVCNETDVEKTTVHMVVAAKTYSALILSVNF